MNFCTSIFSNKLYLTMARCGAFVVSGILFLSVALAEGSSPAEGSLPAKGYPSDIAIDEVIVNADFREVSLQQSAQS
ncbi:MAG: hypothetical protein QF884_08365, partial [Porticoccaceae bacterium]|nr:hypothetical protein [Porticoccaceae bacterium]